MTVYSGACDWKSESKARRAADEPIRPATLLL